MGRGQHSNKWMTPDGANCAVTIILEVTNTPLQASIVTALAIYKTLAHFIPDQKHRITLKWINDVFVDGKKIAGVLVACQNGTRGDG